MTLPRGAAIPTLRRRAAMLAQMREFFAERGVLEVETAAISAAATPDPALQSLRAVGESVDGYLHTSPEFMMKRLLAAGSGDIYQLCRVYRDGEIGRWHEPEFSLLEWYRIDHDEHALMDEVEDLVSALLGSERLNAAAVRVTYDAALRTALDAGCDADAQTLATALRARGIDTPPQSTRDDLLDLAMASVVSAQFPSDRLTFVHDYPASQAALAQIKPGANPVAARFELFLGSIELANGFHELRDATEQRLRFERENAARSAPVPLDEEFLAALAGGLPECAGVALGFDRLVAAASGANSLTEVIAFTHQTLSP